MQEVAGSNPVVTLSGGFSWWKHKSPALAGTQCPSVLRGNVAVHCQVGFITNHPRFSRAAFLGLRLFFALKSYYKSVPNTPLTRHETHGVLVACSGFLTAQTPFEPLNFELQNGAFRNSKVKDIYLEFLRFCASIIT